MANHKLTDKIVSDIVSAREKGVSNNQIAERYGVTSRTVRRWFEQINNRSEDEPELEGEEEMQEELENDIQEDMVDDCTNDDTECQKQETKTSYQMRRTYKRIKNLTPLTPIDDIHPAEALQQIMEERNIDADYIANRSGLSKSCVLNLIAGKRIGNLATWISISRSLGVNLSDLIGE